MMVLFLLGAFLGCGAAIMASAHSFGAAMALMAALGFAPFIWLASTSNDEAGIKPTSQRSTRNDE